MIKFHDAANYAQIERESQPEEDTSVSARVARLQTQYKETGIRRSVDAVMVVIHMGFPHVLVLQVANSFYKLPGGYLDPSESDADGLVTRLQEQLGLPATQQPENGPNVYASEATDWKIHDCLSVWWRPNFDVFLYPYLPGHVTRPKEVKKLYLVELPEHKVIAVPANMKLHAIPFFELYDNAARYGPQFVGLPHILSKYLLPQHLQAVIESTDHVKEDFKVLPRARLQVLLKGE